MAPASPDTAALVAQARAGDATAFETLVRAHIGAVYAHAHRFFGDPHTAEDATQEVWIKVYRSIGGFDGRSAFTTWLFAVTRNVCLDMARRGVRVAAPLDPVEIAAASHADTAGDAIAAVDLERGMRTLAPEDREAFGAVTLYGLPYAQAAEALGVPVGTVKSRVFRARRSLITTMGLDAKGGA